MPARKLVRSFCVQYGRWQITVPVGSEFFAVSQDVFNNPSMWVLMDPDKPHVETRTLKTVFEGDDVLEPNVRYIGTFVAESKLQYFVFEVLPFEKVVAGIL
jgi:hypothetical protein